MIEPEHKKTILHNFDMEAYQNWQKKKIVVCALPC